MPKGVRGGFHTHWTEQGQGQRQALLIHCSLARASAWDRLAGHLDASLRMTAFDLPGHGRSDDWDDRGDIQAVSTQIAGDLIAGQADVIGHSFGGTIALRLALEQPEKLRSLTLIEPVFFAAGQADGGSYGRLNQREHLEFQAMLDAGDRAGATEQFSGAWGGGTPWSELSPTQRNYLESRIGLMSAASSQIYHDRAGLLARLGQLNLPVLIIGGENSPPVMREVLAGLQGRIKGAQVVRIKGAGHMVPITHSAEVAREITRFLDLKDQD